MSIRVTCTGCHTRFNVSDKFAGQEGPCPKCKKKIRVPALSEKVAVHAPESFGPRGADGKAVLKPIFRTEATVTPVHWVLIGATIFGFLAIAFLMQTSVSDKEGFSSLVLVVAAVILAVPCVYAGYTFLRNSELGAHDGQELWTRILACAAVYGISWLAIPVVTYAMDDGVGTAIGVAAMLVIGTFAAYLLLEIDFFMAILHYGLFFGSAILLRVVAGFDALPVTGGGSGNSIDDLINEAARITGCFFV